ncbi:hypothetical protein K438DRAFT_1866862 [Mycena galopus ATCC 62051]|nr:hypothetical protein K438DRAFT_1866862 [Mycena galopus ATCC 62051]
MSVAVFASAVVVVCPASFCEGFVALAAAAASGGADGVVVPAAIRTGSTAADADGVAAAGLADALGTTGDMIIEKI